MPDCRGEDSRTTLSDPRHSGPYGGRRGGRRHSRIRRFPAALPRRFPRPLNHVNLAIQAPNTDNHPRQLSPGGEGGELLSPFPNRQLAWTLGAPADQTALPAGPGADQFAMACAGTIPGSLCSCLGSSRVHAPSELRSPVASLFVGKDEKAGSDAGTSAFPETGTG